MNRSAHIRFTGELGLAQCIVSAIETGLIAALLDSDGPLDDVARLTGLHPDGVDRVLRVLETADWVHHTAAGWEVASWLREAGSEGISLQRSFAVFGHVTQLLTNGTTMMSGEVRHDASGVRALATMFTDSAAQLARYLPLGSGTVLDVGAGSAVWSLAMAGDSGSVIALDRPEVLAAATQRAARQGKAEQLELLPGSFWEVEIPNVDRVLIANVVHLLDEATARALVDRMKQALRPGGEIVIVDVLGAEPFDTATATYALHLRLREPHGTVHLKTDMMEWLTTAGFTNVHTHSLSGQAMDLGAVIGSMPHGSTPA